MKVKKLLKVKNYNVLLSKKILVIKKNFMFFFICVLKVLLNFIKYSMSYL